MADRETATGSSRGGIFKEAATQKREWGCWPQAERRGEPLPSPLPLTTPGPVWDSGILSVNWEGWTK